jgi:hypothetical protein
MRFHTAHVTKEFPQVRANDFWAHGMFFTNHEPMFNQDLHYLQTEWIELPLEPRHLGVPLVASKMISESMVRLAQIVHLSCTDTNTISKWTETRFHIPHITNEFHRLRPNWFLILWYIWRKPCTYLASRLALSPNELNRASTWGSSRRTIIRCVQNYLWAYGTFGANCASILYRHKHWLQMDRNEISQDPSHLVVTSAVSKMISKPVVCSAQSMHLSCVKISTVSKWTESSFHLSLIT